MLKKVWVIAAVLMVVTLASAAPYAQKGTTGRLLTGKVFDHNDNPLPNAVVYLTNTRTRAVKTFIVGNDGSYRFPALAPNIDYEVYAQFNGRKSDSKTVSQFDNREQLAITLRIDTK
ncbi:MAG TPA: carboxypeptidase-like regulatory domain-containing protein [Terriglobales bacterium]|nr:carboxypeptidase-like regulatory domain-containing protein [Terriglobales bacterium]